jgi:hypothetical protein
MPSFAIIDENGTVINTILVENKEVADSITGSNCIEIEENLIVNIGFLYLDGSFVDPEPTVQDNTPPPNIDGL